MSNDNNSNAAALQYYCSNQFFAVPAANHNIATTTNNAGVTPAVGANGCYYFPAPCTTYFVLNTPPPPPPLIPTQPPLFASKTTNSTTMAYLSTPMLPPTTTTSAPTSANPAMVPPRGYYPSAVTYFPSSRASTPLELLQQHQQLVNAGYVRTGTTADSQALLSSKFPVASNHRTSSSTQSSTQTEKDDESPFNLLADEIVLRIFSFMSATDLCVAAVVSRRWRALSSDNHLWKELCFVDFVQFEKEKIKKKVYYREITKSGASIRRVFRDPTRPKKNLTSFILFCKENRPLIKQNKPEIDFAEMTQDLTQRWRALSQAEKNSYAAKARRDKQRYDHELHEYLKDKTMGSRDTRPSSLCYKQQYRKKLEETRAHKKLEVEEDKRRVKLAKMTCNFLAYLLGQSHNA